MMYEETIRGICSHYTEDQANMINRAYNYACTALDGRTRNDGSPFISHPVNVAQIVCEQLGLMADAVAAIFLHEATRADHSLMDTIGKNFPRDIVEIATSLNKISEIKPLDTRLEAGRYRQLIASYSTDPRVFLIKLADRLEIMRMLYILPKSDQMRKNAETILLYVPLAHQTGVYNIKSELEDLWLKYAEPAQYRSITNQLKATERDREELMREFVNPLKERISAKGISYRLKARTKSAYSIWKKMNKQHIPFSQVYDVFAIRFIIDAPPQKEIDLCWDVYSLVTEEYTPDTSRLRDWLSVPKPNGYQSLHTTVSNARGKSIEVQIRTERMDYEAEIGNAAHWAYKGIKRENGLNTWLDRVNSMIKSPAYSDYQQVAQDVLQDVFVFTPNGELRQLKGGATVLDFAFDIHSNIGLRCIGARVGGKMVSIREQLKTGDVVEILTGKNQKPNEDWLQYVVTSKAKNKIKQKLKEIENKQASEGKEILDRRLNNWKLVLGDDQLCALIKKYKFRTANEFYGSVGKGEIDPIDIKTFIGEWDAAATAQTDTRRSQPSDRQIGDTSDIFVIGGQKELKSLGYKMAKCCNPVYGDDVFGFVTINDGIKIHRMSCPNAARLLTNYSHRVQKVRWKEDAATSSFQTTLKIVLGEESSTNNVIASISSFNASIRALSTRERSKGDCEMSVTLFVPSVLMLDKIVATIKKLRNVKQVTRQ